VVGVFLDVEGVAFVDAFEVDDARFAVLVGTVDDAAPEFLGGDGQFFTDLDVFAEVEHLVQFLRLFGGDVCLAGARVGESELLACLHGLHEVVGDADGDVEIREVAFDGVPEVFGDLAVVGDEFAGLLQGLGEAVVREVVGVVESKGLGQGRRPCSWRG